MLERYYFVDGIFRLIEGPVLSYNPCEIMPSVNLVNCFSDLCEKYKLVPKKDLINSYLRILLMDVEDEKKILPKILPNGLLGTYKYADDRFEYCYQKHSGNAPCEKGHWLKKASCETTVPNSETRGYCIFSFVSIIDGCNTPLEAVECVAKYLGVNLLERNTTQPNEIGGYIFVERAHSYLPSATEDVATYFLGRHQESYEFHNMYGKAIFALRVWKAHGQDPIHLFMTRQRHEINGKYLDTCIAPPWKKAIFNLHLINNQRNDDIFIHDDIGRTKTWKMSGINTWSGESTFVSEIEWVILKDRSVKYVFDPRNHSSCEIAIKLKKEFYEIATELELVTYEEIYQEEYRESLSSSDPDDKNVVVKIRTLKSDDEFYDLAKEYHGNEIDKRPKQEGLKYQVRKLRDLSGIKEDRQFMVHPLFRKGEMIVLFGAPGVGKSFVALDLVLMIAGGGSWNERLSAKQQYKILYIDAENDSLDNDQRLKGLINGNYGNEKEILKNIDYIYLLDSDNEDNFDLSLEEKRQEIGDLVKGVDLLVLDNLDALTSPNISTNTNEWMNISTWIKSLNKKGTAVLLLHHENKAGKMSGTVKISQNANMTISLSLPSVDQEAFPIKGTKVIFQPEKTRRLRKDEKKGFLLVYNDENGRIDRTVLSLDGRPIEKENKDLVTEEEKNNYELDELDIYILNKVRKTDVAFVKNGDFKHFKYENGKGRKSTAIGDHLIKLVKLRLLESNEKPKNERKYWMAGREAPTGD